MSHIAEGVVLLLFWTAALVFVDAIAMMTKPSSVGPEGMRSVRKCLAALWFGMVVLVVAGAVR